MQVKLLLFTFYLNGGLGLHAVSIGKPSEQMSKFWTVRFLKTKSEPNFGFPHIPTNDWKQQKKTADVHSSVTFLQPVCAETELHSDFQCRSHHRLPPHLLG